MPKKVSNTMPFIDEMISDGIIGSVKVWADSCSDVKEARKYKTDRFLCANVSASSINTSDLDRAYNYAIKILKAVKRARQINKQRGIKS